MNTCQFCGHATRNPDRTCDNCWEIVSRLPRWIEEHQAARDWVMALLEEKDPVPVEDDGASRQRVGFGTSLEPVLAENAPVEYTIIFDGGAKGNPGPGYGSYIVTENGVPWPGVRRRQYGTCTSNEAEYKTLIEALKELCYDVGVSSQDTLVIRGDSKLVLYQIGADPATHKPWRVNEPRLRALRDEALNLLADFKTFEVRWWERDHSVEALGH